jgi:hypothetical protein
MGLSTVASNLRGHRVTLARRYARSSLHTVHHQIEHWFQQFPSVSPDGQRQLVEEIEAWPRGDAGLATRVDLLAQIFAGICTR